MTPTSDEPKLIQTEQVVEIPSIQDSFALSSLSQELDYKWLVQMFEERKTSDPLFAQALKKYGRDGIVSIYLEYRNQETSLSMQGNES